MKILMCGPNVIESEEHIMKMAEKVKNIVDKYDVEFYFKTSFDKANRSSLNSYRGCRGSYGKAQYLLALQIDRSSS